MKPRKPTAMDPQRLRELGLAPTQACICKGPEVLKCQRDCEAAPQHNPTPEEALRGLVAALREYASFPPKVLPALRAAERAIGVEVPHG